MEIEWGYIRIYIYIHMIVYIKKYIHTHVAEL